MTVRDDTPRHGTLRDDKGPLLGRQVSGSEVYDPTLLFAVPRENARRTLPGGAFAGFGEDLWQCYELSWLDAADRPQAMLGLITVPATSANIIESKSLKLYLNSLNSHRLHDAKAAKLCIETDLATVAEAPVSIQLFDLDAAAFNGATLGSQSLDELAVTAAPVPDAALLRIDEGQAKRDGCWLHTHRLRSLCPVTAQPDWGTLVVQTKGVAIEPEGLMSYLLSFRNHQEFHEQCVERMYCDISERIAPDFLSVHALYTRRGGLAICPWRCSEQLPAPRYRLNRQ